MVRVGESQTNVVMGHATVGEEEGVVEFVVPCFVLSGGFTQTAGDVDPPDFCVAAFGLLLGAGDR